MSNSRGRWRRSRDSAATADGAAAKDPAASVRLWSALALGLAVGVAISVPTTWQFGLLIGWMSAAGLFVGWVWFTIWPLNSRETAQHATRDDPG